MTFHELLTEIQKLEFEELRVRTDEYLEAVVTKGTLEPLQRTLSSYFGQPLKPEGQSPSGKVMQQAAPYGGIRKDQTMYARDDGNHYAYALLWPWGSGVRVTVKIVRTRGAAQGFGLKVFFKNLFSRK